jgi:PAS domain S-box-containing protein
MSTQHTFDARRVTARHGSHQHSVQFYKNDQGLIDELTRFVESAMKADHTCLIVATEAHRDALLAQLSLRGLDMAQAVRQKRFLCLDAAETLSAIMFNGVPDSIRFDEVIGGTITYLLNAAPGRRSRVAIFGEMVALLWEQAKPEAALRLEQLWNNFLSTQPVYLHCAYPMAGFDRAAHSRVFQQICTEHCYVLPDESYTSLGDESERLHAISVWQQKALALEAEIEQRKRTEEDLRISEERLRLTQKAARIGSWELDLETDACILSEEAAEMLGLLKGCGTSADLLGCMYYSGDRENFARCLRLAASKSREFEAEFRLTRSGQVHWISARGKAFYNQGRPLLLGVLIDITAAKKAQHRRLSRRESIAA